MAFSVFAFTEEECATAAENVFQAQAILNENKALFDETHKKIKATPASEFKWSQALKTFITSTVDKLKPGGDPVKAGNAVFVGCQTSKEL